MKNDTAQCNKNHHGDGLSYQYSCSCDGFLVTIVMAIGLQQRIEPIRINIQGQNIWLKIFKKHSIYPVILQYPIKIIAHTTNKNVDVKTFGQKVNLKVYFKRIKYINDN